MLTSHSSVGAGGGMQTLTMTNAASTAAQVANNSTGATIVQYAQGADGQFFIPGTCLGTSRTQTNVFFFVSICKSAPYS